MSTVLRWFKLLAVIWPFTAGVALASVAVERVDVPEGKSILLVRGEFDLNDDPAMLLQAATSSGATIVTFDSNGGNVSAAIRFGRAIRSAGLETVQLRAKQCASACALAFVGGLKRNAEPGSIGVHQSSFSTDAGLDASSAVSAVQAVTANIMTYLIEMGVDPRLLQLSLSTGSDDMRYLTTSEMVQYGVTGTSGTVAAFAARSPSVPTQPTTPPPAKPSAAPGSSPEARALAFTARYHEAWSKPNSLALAFMSGVYAETVQFYGKPTSLHGIMDEKRAFAERWPQRAYSVKGGTEHIICSVTCSVSAVVEWFAQSPLRGKTSSGAAEISFVWNPATEKIEAETSRVMQTDKGAVAPQRIIAQWQQENGDCRGGSGNADATWRACDRREVISSKLQTVGWCYGREGEAGYQMQWHICGR
jgi:hypothetical protein